MYTSRIARQTLRQSITSSRLLSFSRRTLTFRSTIRQHIARPTFLFNLPAPRAFQTSSKWKAGIMPHSEDPEPPNAEPHDDASKAAEISDEEFHEHADR
ncbi:hypothetical protein LTS18_002348, partial [Coniosporium uncinatum]